MPVPAGHSIPFFMNPTNLPSPILAKLSKPATTTLANFIETQCNNCGTDLQGTFCHRCGQKDVNYNKPLHEAIGLLLDTWFSLDNKVLRSIGPIFLKPGYLSREFIAGRRARYTSPLKMFFFASVLYFTLASLTGRNGNVGNIGNATEGDPALKTKLQMEIARTTPTATSQTSFWERLEAKGKSMSQNPQELKQRFNTAFSYMFFALMPLFALMLKLFLHRKKRLYFEHLIYSVHLHVFGFLFLALLYLIQIATSLKEDWISGIACGAFMLYFLLAMRQFYGMRWFAGVLRTLVILFSYMILFVMVTLSMVIMVIMI